MVGISGFGLPRHLTLSICRSYVERAFCQSNPPILQSKQRELLRKKCLCERTWTSNNGLDAVNRQEQSQSNPEVSGASHHAGCRPPQETWTNTVRLAGNETSSSQYGEEGFWLRSGTDITVPLSTLKITWNMKWKFNDNKTGYRIVEKGQNIHSQTHMYLHSSSLSLPRWSLDAMAVSAIVIVVTPNRIQSGRRCPP